MLSTFFLHRRTDRTGVQVGDTNATSSDTSSRILPYRILPVMGVRPMNSSLFAKIIGERGSGICSQAAAIIQREHGNLRLGGRLGLRPSSGTYREQGAGQQKSNKRVFHGLFARLECVARLSLSPQGRTKDGISWEYTGKEDKTRWAKVGQARCPELILQR